MYDFKPDWVSPPGHTIVDVMEERGITKRYLAFLLQISLPELETLLSGEMIITRRMCTKLARFLGASQNFWFNREKQYRKDKLRLGL